MSVGDAYICPCCQEQCVRLYPVEHNNSIQLWCGGCLFHGPCTPEEQARVDAISEEQGETCLLWDMKEEGYVSGTGKVTPDYRLATKFTPTGAATYDATHGEYATATVEGWVANWGEQPVHNRKVDMRLEGGRFLSRRSPHAYSWGRNLRHRTIISFRIALPEG